MTNQSFKPIDPKPDFPKLEEEVLKYWEENRIFEKTLKQNKGSKRFVFFEGPPTANGKPGIHHIEARAFKDLIPRFQTMQGKYVLRKGGWDTHGLPVELEVEKQLGISGKKQIESIKSSVRDSIIEFNRLCKQSVWKYKEEWERLTKRMGFWVDLENPYVTYHNSYIESVWWIIKQIWDKGLIYLGHKVVPYCPRCGTALSSHEVAQGYKTVWEESVYVKFRLKSQPDTYILSWTTTPWTLPGNVALAVGKDIDYVKEKVGDEYYILAKDRVNAIDLFAYPKNDLEVVESNIVEEFKGSKLVGLEYEPLFEVPSLESDKSYKVYAADFVTTTDGTGVVHTAVMYGEDDYNLGTEIGLPKHHTVDETGIFTADVKDLAGMPVKAKETEQKIFEYLKSKNFLHRTEKYQHEYPHCWRCSTPLLYYARDSWFIAMSELRDKMKKNNEQINWVPEYIKHGRFGEWLDGLKDWAISRERYWGTPLPIWQCSDCKEYKVVGSIKELGVTKNHFYFSRHALSQKNVLQVNNGLVENDKYGLTDEGLKQAEALAIKVEAMGGIDLIFTSDFTRTKHTAEIVAKKLGIDYQIDQRLREYNVGVYEGKSEDEYHQEFGSKVDRWTTAPDRGENWTDIKDRMVEFINEINEKYKDKKILIISHGDPLWVLQQHYGFGRDYPYYADLYELEISMPDLHRPYIDDVVLKCEKCNGEARRIPAVLDVWFDSGAMPYAQWHYPFENQDMVDANHQFPADYISEAIDQTRGWFYTLLAISTLLDKGPAYKNVINLGHLLDTKGQKMSKSKGNVIDPWDAMAKYGVDSLRWYMYSVNQPGDNKLFGEKDAELVLRKNFVILWNVLSFFVTYANHDNWDSTQTTKELDILDQWILVKLQELVNQVTESLENYDVFRAARSIEEFINELSTWYVRRSRDRKGPAVYQTLYLVLKILSAVLAPFTPFIAEMIWQALKTEADKESVHMIRWPEKKELSEKETKLLKDMDLVRNLVVSGHSLRKDSNVKLRQPLSSFSHTAKALTSELEKILANELNVKMVKVGDKIEFDLNITPELKKEGLAAELTRLVQEMRKKSGLKVGEMVKLSYDTKDDELRAAFELLDTKKTYISQILEESGGEEVDIDGKRVAIRLS